MDKDDAVLRLFIRNWTGTHHLGDCSPHLERGSVCLQPPASLPLLLLRVSF